ncbi:hypothetical protein JW921_01125 [Candidatus Fermentibacterales bacterium]|nr:hypothetical protein [Candidatus Fermentibacterales bacterium]
MRSSKRCSICEEVSIELDPLGIVRRLGGDSRSLSLLGTVRQEIVEVERLLAPRAAWLTTCEVTVAEGVCRLDGLEARSENLASLLGRCESASLFLLTVGPEIDELIERQSGLPHRQVVTDAIGSEAAEATARWVSRALGQRARLSGCRVTPRFSPGYGDFGLESQAWFVENLGEAVGVSLAGSTMVPRKSISGVVGWKRS